MLARHAESLFWAGRYIERAEDTARMLDVTYHGLLEAHAVGGRAVVEATCSRSSGSTGRSPSSSRACAPPPCRSSSCSTPTTPAPSCRRSSAARENARAARELISSELWEADQQLPPRAALAGTCAPTSRPARTSSTTS